MVTGIKSFNAIEAGLKAPKVKKKGKENALRELLIYTDIKMDISNYSNKELHKYIQDTYDVKINYNTFRKIRGEFNRRKEIYLEIQSAFTKRKDEERYNAYEDLKVMIPKVQVSMNIAKGLEYTYNLESMLENEALMEGLPKKTLGNKSLSAKEISMLPNIKKTYEVIRGRLVPDTKYGEIYDFGKDANVTSDEKTIRDYFMKDEMKKLVNEKFSFEKDAFRVIAKLNNEYYFLDLMKDLNGKVQIRNDNFKNSKVTAIKVSDIKDEISSPVVFSNILSMYQHRTASAVGDPLIENIKSVIFI